MVSAIHALLVSIGLGWFDIKMLLERSVGFDSDALHAFAGVAIQLLAAFVLRSSVTRLLPLVIVAILAVANETVDLWVERWPNLSMQLGESVKDLLLTLALPLLLMLVARWRPGLFRR